MAQNQYTSAPTNGHEISESVRTFHSFLSNEFILNPAVNERMTRPNISDADAKNHILSAIGWQGASEYELDQSLYVVTVSSSLILLCQLKISGNLMRNSRLCSMPSKDIATRKPQEVIRESGKRLNGKGPDSRRSHRRDRSMQDFATSAVD